VCAHAQRARDAGDCLRVTVREKREERRREREGEACDEREGVCRDARTGHKEAEEPVGRHEWHRELQLTQMVPERRQVQLDELLGDLTVDGVADHGLDVVVGEHLLDHVRQQPERVVLRLDEEQDRRRYKVHALAVANLRVALRVGEQHAAHALDELVGEARVLREGAPHVQLDGVLHALWRGRRDQPLVQTRLRLLARGCTAQQHPRLAAVLGRDALGDGGNESRRQWAARAVLFSPRLLQQLWPVC